MRVVGRQAPPLQRLVVFGAVDRANLNKFSALGIPLV